MTEEERTGEINLSIAYSLRRIADVLEKMERRDQSSNLADALREIRWHFYPPPCLREHVEDAPDEPKAE